MIKTINKYACSIILFLIGCLLYLAGDAYYKINYIYNIVEDANVKIFYK